ncbi:MAG: outer membrane beta-barrel protein [Chitinophagales bacterium]|nr:outer membrane beta-barrel protein [Chitinophagales bacterium]
MDEFVISVKTAVRVHGDTTSYRVDSFITDPLANTEDVLKRLPGVEVSRDGKITIQGKPVNKMFINGKEYFSDDLRSVIQNLPAEILEKIEVADYRDEDAVFTGNKETSNEKVINFQMKKKYSGGIYGRTAAGWGTQKRNQGGAFANYMDDNAFRLTLMGNLNNTGMSDAAGDNGNTSNNSWSNPGVRTEQKGNINFSYDKGKAFQLNGAYSFNNNNTYLERSSYRTTFLPYMQAGSIGDSSMLQASNNEQKSGNTTHNIFLRTRYKISPRMSLSTVANIQTAKQSLPRISNDITYEYNATTVSFDRRSISDNTRATSSYGLNNSLSKQFSKKGRTLLIRWNINYSGNRSRGNIENTNNYYSPESKTDVINTTSEEGNNINSVVNIYYTEPLGKHNNVSVSINNIYNRSNNNKAVAVANAGVYSVDTNQSRSYKNINNNNNIGITYQYSNEKISGGVGFEMEPYSRKSLQAFGTGTDIIQTGINYFPRLFSRYRVSKTSDISFSYNGGINPPNISQIQPIPDYTDSLNIYTGNPHLSPELSNSINLRFGNNNLKKGSNTWAYIQANWVNNKIINNTELTGSKKNTMPVNANGNFVISSSVSHTEPLIRQKLKGTMGLSVNVTNNVSIVNGSLQRIANYNISPKARLSYYTGKWYDGSLDYSYNRREVTGLSQPNSLVQSHILAHDGTFIFSYGFRLSYYINYISNKGIAQNLQQDFFLTNIMFDKTFNKPHGLSLRLYAFDIFNNYPTVQRTIGDNYYEDVSVNRIGSYYLFSIVYKFTSFPEKKEVGHKDDQ